MRIVISAEDFNNIISAMEKTRLELAQKADSYSYSFESMNGFDEYVALRQKELEIAGTIYLLYKQKNDTPLADWEKALLRGENQ